MNDDLIEFLELNGVVWVRPLGDASFLNAESVKIFSRKMVEAGARNFTVDLDRCTGLDSTFMGTLAALALQLRELGEGQVRVVNVSPEINRLLSKLSLNSLFNIQAK